MADIPANLNTAIGANGFREAVCVNVARVYDSCSDKDCVEDLLVHFTNVDQEVIDSASCIRAKSATIRKILLDVEPVAFQKGFYSVDLTYFIEVTVEAICPAPYLSPTLITGLACFTKKVILFGSEGSVKVFSSEDSCNSPVKTNMPRATVDVFVTGYIKRDLKFKTSNLFYRYIIIPKCAVKKRSNIKTIIPETAVSIRLFVFAAIIQAGIDAIIISKFSSIASFPSESKSELAKRADNIAIGICFSHLLRLSEILNLEKSTSGVTLEKMVAKAQPITLITI